MKNSIAVIGAGNGGTAIAAHISQFGADVHLCDLFPQYLTDIQASGGIHLTENEETSFCPIKLVTDNVADAIRGVKLVMVVTPSFTHKMIAEACASALVDGQIVVLNPGRTGGALEFLNTIQNAGCVASVTIAEAQTLIYACRKTSGDAVTIYGVKKEVELGAFPAKRTQEVLDVLKPYYPQFVAAENCLVTSLANIGALFHPAPIILNVGRVESDENGFRYYWDGISPSVATLIEKIDAERLAVGEAYGVKLIDAKEWLRQSYNVQGDSLYELLQSNEAYGGVKAPSSIDARYITEDVPMSIVPIAELGKLAGVPTPNMDAIITIASSILAKDFRNEGRSLDNLGLTGMSKEAVAHYFETGEK